MDSRSVTRDGADLGILHYPLLHAKGEDQEECADANKEVLMLLSGTSLDKGRDLHEVYLVESR